MKTSEGITPLSLLMLRFIRGYRGVRSYSKPGSALYNQPSCPFSYRLSSWTALYNFLQSGDYFIFCSVSTQLACKVPCTSCRIQVHQNMSHIFTSCCNWNAVGCGGKDVLRGEIGWMWKCIAESILQMHCIRCGTKSISYLKGNSPK